MIEDITREFLDKRNIEESCKTCIQGAISIPFDCHGRMFGVTIGGGYFCDHCKNINKLDEETYERLVRETAHYVLANSMKINEEGEKKKARFEAESRALMVEKKGFLSRLFGL